ncbi:ER membrane protein DP1/Yop1 [Tulasnella sp. 403]|nr:ER membrane protein DP1/Yop1 [Tulasnella sp. 403]
MDVDSTRVGDGQLTARYRPPFSLVCVFQMSTSQDTNPTVENAKATINNAAEQLKAHPAVKQAQDRFNDYMVQLDKELSRYPIINQLEEKTNIPKAYGAIAAAFTFVCLIFVNALALPVSNTIGWAFPAYLSFRALESPGHDDDVQWLTYWVVFGFLTWVESIALRPVLYYLPYYFPLKTAFVLWLQLPATRGAQTFYHAVYRPVLLNLRGRRATYNSPPSTIPVDGHDKSL